MRRLQFPKTVGSNIAYLGFNWLDPVVGGGKTASQARRNRLLRQAVSIALNWEEKISIFNVGQGMAAAGPLPPGFFGWRPDSPASFNPVVYKKGSDGRVMRRSLSEAKRLLKAAGYPDGRDAKTGQPRSMSGGGLRLTRMQKTFFFSCTGKTAKLLTAGKMLRTT